MSGKGEGCVVILAVVAIFCLGIAFGVQLSNGGVRAERQRAIDAGAAYWAVDAKTGEREFVYGKAE